MSTKANDQTRLTGDNHYYSLRTEVIRSHWGQKPKLPTLSVQNILCFMQVELQTVLETEPIHQCCVSATEYMPIGLFNVRGKQTESEHVIAFKQYKWKCSTCVLVPQPHGPLGDGAPQLCRLVFSEDGQQEVPQIKKKKKKRCNLHTCGRPGAQFLQNKYFIKS